MGTPGGAGVARVDAAAADGRHPRAVTDGPVVVVRAPGQDLPALPGHTEVVDDPREGLGPVQGLAAGLATLKDRAEVAFVSSTDMPFLHPAFVRRVLRAAQDGADVGLPVARGYPQPLAASYRTRLAPVAERLVAEERLRPAFLFEECVVDRLDEDALRAIRLAAFDPGIESVVNVRAGRLPGGGRGRRRRWRSSGSGRWPTATLAHSKPARPTVAGRRPPPGWAGRARGGGAERRPDLRDDQTPLATGDTVFFLSADAGG
jgi:molybdopterin-guanine dinucleotide biosynthesis protein A